MQLIPFEPQHLDHMGLEKSGLFLDHFSDSMARVKMYASAGIAFTMVDSDGNPLVCGGIVKPWDGVGEAWLIPGPLVVPGSELAKTVIFGCRRWIKIICKKERLHRLQACAVVDDNIDPRWFRAMGFKDEPALLEKYTPDGKDCHLYARTYTWQPE